MHNGEVPEESAKTSDAQKPVANDISSWSLIRLKSPRVLAESVTSADFIKDKVNSPFIQEISKSGAVLTLYGYTTPGKPPSFAEFLADFTALELPIIPKYAYVVIVRMHDATLPWYAMPFGAGGRFLLVEDMIDLDAARQVSVGVTTPSDPTQPGEIRQIGTTVIGSRPMRVQKRASGSASLGDFSFDPFSEILNDIDAKPQDPAKYGSTVRAGQGVGFGKRICLDDIAANVELFEEANDIATARDISNGSMRPVKDRQVIRSLDDALAAALRDESNDSIAFSIPDFIAPDESLAAHLTLVGRESTIEDIDIVKYRRLLVKQQKLADVDIEYLKKAEISVGEDRVRRFRIYNCLSAQVVLDDQTYVHNERDWFQIPENILKYINAQVDAIEPWNDRLPSPQERVTEPDYTKRIADRKSFLYLDRASQSAFAGQSAVEICDLLAIDDEKISFIHAKRDFSSATLSHLFNQGKASALLMLESAPRARFRNRLVLEMKRAAVKPTWSRRMRAFISDEGFSPRKTRVVYAILGSWNGKKPSERMPFMSKLNLSTAARDLRGRQFDVRLASIQMDGPSSHAGDSENGG